MKQRRWSKTAAVTLRWRFRWFRKRKRRCVKCEVHVTMYFLDQFLDDRENMNSERDHDLRPHVSLHLFCFTSAAGLNKSSTSYITTRPTLPLVPSSSLHHLFHSSWSNLLPPSWTVPTSIWKHWGVSIPSPAAAHSIKVPDETESWIEPKRLSSEDMKVLALYRGRGISLSETFQDATENLFSIPMAQIFYK